MKRSVVTRSPAETAAVAASLLPDLKRGDVVALWGGLGSGKTQFVKGICAALRVDEPVTSPTFVLMNRYRGRDEHNDELLVYHFDLYRVRSLVEVYDLGFEEVVSSGGMSFIEWPGLCEPLLPAGRIDVHLGMTPRDSERSIVIERLDVAGGGNVR